MRIPQRKSKGKAKRLVEIYVCPMCAPRYAELAFARAGRRCDSCRALIRTPGEENVRSKTDTQLAGAWAQHRTMQVVLCPECAASYDQTGGALLKAALLFLLALLFLGCLGFLSSRRQW
jgi:hypothetical protein